MDRHWLFYILLFLAVSLEASITTIPLTLIILLIFYLAWKEKVLPVVLAFIVGIILDAIQVSNLGFRSIFFVIFLFVVSLYERKFGVKTYPFVFLSSFLGSFLYGVIFDLERPFLQAILTSFLALFLFRLFSIQEKGNL